MFVSLYILHTPCVLVRQYTSALRRRLPLGLAYSHFAEFCRTFDTFESRTVSIGFGYESSSAGVCAQRVYALVEARCLCSTLDRCIGDTMSENSIH
jgi:hypothetical protein